MKIKTSLLQDMVSKAIKGASNNKMIPITNLLGIEVKGENITLMTTDGSNQLRISEKVDYDPMHGPQDFYTIINADIFSKLVGKTTTEFIILTNNENYLEVKGNGTYKIEIPTNEDGEIIKFPTFSINTQESKQISIEKLKNILNTAKVSVAKTMEVPCLTGYYIADKVATTDREMMCGINEKLLDTGILLSSDMAELLQILTGDYVYLFQEDNKLLFKTDTITVYGKQLEGLDIYPVKALDNLMNLAYDNIAKVNKQDLLNVLDRMSIFVTDYDKNGVFLSFTEDGLQLTSQKSNASELLEMDMDANKEFVPFNCLIDIEMLKAQVQTNSTDIVEIHYGQEKSIKLIDGNTTLIICLLDNNE